MGLLRKGYSLTQINGNCEVGQLRKRYSITQINMSCDMGQLIKRYGITQINWNCEMGKLRKRQSPYWPIDNCEMEQSRKGYSLTCINVNSKIGQMRKEYSLALTNGRCEVGQFRKQGAEKLFSEPEELCVMKRWRGELYVVQSVSSQTEFFALVWSVVTTPAARGIIPRVSWASVLKASFLCASCVTQLQLLSRSTTFPLRLSRWRISVNKALASNSVSSQGKLLQNVMKC